MIRQNKKKKYSYKRKNYYEFQSVLSKEAPFNYVEAYKALRTNFDFVSSANDAKSILVTSAVPEESKSVTVINLALTLARDGKSVIIVDCDLRKPSLHRYLKLEKETQGLSTVLSFKDSLSECIVELKEMKISVLPAGILPPNPSELLNQKQMKELLEDLKQSYDYVILDAPPVNVVTDAVVVGRMVDGVILIVRSKFATARNVRLAKQRLEAVNIKLLGAVLTRFDIPKANWDSRYNYGYSYENNRKRKRKK